MEVCALAATLFVQGALQGAGCLEVAKRLTLSQGGYRTANGLQLFIITGCFAFSENKLDSINKHEVATVPITGITVKY